ncbi:hypothetical protein Mboo_0902 [Methanoregula boonei 6A8]|uniref:Uncharacterized protein n=1 Tax=Methanoregula boonei (strain DSM 21154 / JCM 14090 / 6A8) TaxID=456442 RepID=A7I6Q9_METB6|nr:hypothetical protein [Methanoregula boonei]ABS55420.1 hypothetical protein Mboo_0902 [Methanoregula boonei 6A8]
MEQLQDAAFLPFSFEEAYEVLKNQGPAQVTSALGTVYTIDAYSRPQDKGTEEQIIRVHPRSGYTYIRHVYIHPDCWGSDLTCQGVRVEDIYNGKPGIFAWLKDHCNKTASFL